MIESKVFEFLNDIKSNNNRKWFNKNKQKYKRSLEQIQNFTNELEISTKENTNVRMITVAMSRKKSPRVPSMK
mgnify:CR=1 FL=1